MKATWGYTLYLTKDVIEYVDEGQLRSRRASGAIGPDHPNLPRIMHLPGEDGL